MGPLRLTVRHPGRDPEVIDVKSVKAKGLLALLAVAPDFCRSRKFLQEMLWSDRARTQASASLRQEVLNLSRLHPALDAALERSRTSIALNPDLVRVVETPDAPRAVFLEDLAVTDRVFRDWLNGERQARAVRADGLAAATIWPAAGQVRRRQIAFLSTPKTGEATAFLEDMISHFIGCGLSDSLLVDIVDADADAGSGDTTWIQLHASLRDCDHTALRVSVLDGPRKTRIWSDIGVFKHASATDFDDADILSFCSRTVVAVLDALSVRGQQGVSEDGVDAGIMAHLATRKIFSMDRDELIIADGLLASAFERSSQGVFLAWRGLVRSFQAFERHDLDYDALRDTARELCYKAQESSPGNSMVLGLIASNRLVTADNPHVLQELAERSIRLNAANALAWDALSTAKLSLGERSNSYTLALRAQKISSHSPFGFWWDMGRAESAIAMGFVSEAIRFLEISASKAPLFHPPRRYLAALYALRGDEEKALAMAAELSAIEPDFSILRLAEDDHYPISLLRKSALFDADRLRALA